VEKWLELSLAPVTAESDAVTGLLLLGNDETERRQLTAQFHEAQRRDAVGRLAGGLAHDFNNLLTVILGYSDGLLRRMDEHDPYRERIASIHRAGNRGAALTRQLLAISRKQVSAAVVLRPVDVIHEVDPMLRRMVGEDVEVHTDLSGDTRRVRIDRGQLEQVLLNLAANARDAMGQGGELFIATRPDEDPAKLRVIVRDTGTGMDEDTLAHCFEPFYTTKQRGEGTGLGLAAAYGIVAQSGGSIAITSQLGAGTTVTMSFPVVDAPLEYVPQPALPTPQSVPHLQAGRILLVEDEDEVRSLLRRTLRERGYVVLQASSGPQALAMLAAHDGALDLLVTDVVMPGMKGPELARAVVQRGRKVPVLFVSGYAEDLVEELGDLDTPVGFLAKPFTPDELVEHVGRLIGAGRDDELMLRSDTPRREPFESSAGHPDPLRSSF
jgi:nitrogen-specific signal transduction histidine kinase/CheY-like chemotaxis protein